MNGLNELLWLAMLTLNFGAILVLFRFFGRVGLYVWIPVAIILANIQVLKAVTIFGLEATLGNVIYAGSFLVTDILSEIYGKKAARRAVFFGFFALIATTILMNLALAFEPSEADTVQESLVTIFSFLPRVAAASLAAFLVSQLHDVWAYDFWRRRLPQTRYIWIRNNASTLVSQGIDSLVFTTGAFLGVFPTDVFLQILLTTYVLKAIVAVVDTPLVYVARRWRDTGRVRELVDVED